MLQTITLTVNGMPRQATVGPKTFLMDVLRNELRPTGVKDGRAEGHCGACLVIMNGQAVRSCLIKASRAAGAHILTIEGLTQADQLHPLQRAFIDYGAVQCGFCTPGLILAAKVLLDRNPRRSEAEIKATLKDNLCRCTGYNNVIRAVRAAAGEPVPVLPPTFTYRTPLAAVGRFLPCPEAVDKVTGKAIYADDLYFEHMLYARALRSSYPHARVLKVDTSRVKALPGVVAVLTAEDIPGARNHGVVTAHWPVLAYDKVRYVGDAIAIVAAESEALGEEALKLIAVEYEPLPVVTDPIEALKPDAPRVHESGTFLKHISVRKGDVELGFAQADLIIERKYHTPSVEHAFLEPEAGLAVPESKRRESDETRLTVYSGGQIPFLDRQQITATLSVPEEQVRVVNTHIGGPFGGKEDISARSTSLCWLAPPGGR